MKPAGIVWVLAPCVCKQVLHQSKNVRPSFLFVAFFVLCFGCLFLLGGWRSCCFLVPPCGLRCTRFGGMCLSESSVVFFYVARALHNEGIVLGSGASAFRCISGTSGIYFSPLVPRRARNRVTNRSPADESYRCLTLACVLVSSCFLLLMSDVIDSLR